ncbi:MAG: hypothetical protein IPH83_07140 [Gammaproteobacteria bacterium]|nr:hypothetical protein [Gammaproteobacteria bacterium]
MTTTLNPLAPARLSADGIHWIVDTCPHCGRRHHHGAGGPGADPAEYLGHRVAHCGSGAGYVLVAAPTP